MRADFRQMRRSDDRAALALFERAHELAPHNAEIARDLGAILLRVGEPEALKHLWPAVAILDQLRALGDGARRQAGGLHRCTASGTRQILLPTLVASQAPQHQH